MSTQTPKFDRTTWRRIRKIAGPFFFSELRWRARGMLLLLALFSCSVSGLNVLMSYVGRDFMTALSLKEKEEFIRHLWRYLGAFALATPVVVFYRYTEERLGLLWRLWLSKKILRRYFSDRAYYQINATGAIDNPDQRLEEDIRSFCTMSLSFLLIFFNSCIALFAFMGILSSISFHLTIAVILYSVAGSVTTYLLGRPLIGLNFTQLRREADYRYKLVNIRDNAESIAFLGDEQKEFTRTRQRLKAALRNLLNIINWNRNLNFFTTGYNYLVTILPTIIVAPLYLDGKIEFGVVTQAGFAFAQVLGALSVIVLNFGSLSAYAAVINRLGSFWEALDDASESKGTGIQVQEAGAISFDRVTISTPKRDQVLLHDVTISFERRPLLIAGASGSGKSSVLRSIAGLWSTGSGTISRPPLSESFFLPQRPYMPLGSLRSQLLYAGGIKAASDRELRRILREVGLEETLDRVGGFDVILDWPNLLSTGEQQRLAFARLLLRRPKYVYLDEATTAIDRENEQKLYAKLSDFTDFYISIGYEATIGRFHHSVLRLTGGGKWEVGML